VTIALLAAKLIQSFEGCKLAAYWDPTGKVWTIGFGHTKGVTNGDAITFDQAVALLEQDAAPLIALVQDRPMVEAAALVSFGHNCGIGALKRVLSGGIQVVGEQFMADGVPYGEVSGGAHPPGLAARRGLEAALVESSRGS
jgi:lysozyme